MSSLDNRSNSDMALAVDVDLHADGKIFDAFLGRSPKRATIGRCWPAV